MDDVACDTFDQLPKFECHIQDDIKMALLYIAGYVTKDDNPDEIALINDTSLYYLKGIKFRGYLISRFFSFDNSRILNFAILSC